MMTRWTLRSPSLRAEKKKRIELSENAQRSQSEHPEYNRPTTTTSQSEHPEYDRPTTTTAHAVPRPTTHDPPRPENTNAVELIRKELERKEAELERSKKLVATTKRLAKSRYSAVVAIRLLFNQIG